MRKPLTLGPGGMLYPDPYDPNACEFCRRGLHSQCCSTRCSCAHDEAALEAERQFYARCAASVRSALAAVGIDPASLGPRFLEPRG